MFKMENSDGDRACLSRQHSDFLHSTSQLLLNLGHNMFREEQRTPPHLITALHPFVESNVSGEVPACKQELNYLRVLTHTQTELSSSSDRMLSSHGESTNRQEKGYWQPGVQFPG